MAMPLYIYKQATNFYLPQLWNKFFYLLKNFFRNSRSFSFCQQKAGIHCRLKNRQMGNVIAFMLVAISLSILALASDQDPLQDFCVADPTIQVLMNGLPCKDPKMVHANDFSFSGLHQSGNTSNPLGSAVTPVTVFEIPGLNTLGISLIRIDYARGGVNPPHTHPRASEILTVLEGSLEVGFVSSSPENRRITKVLHKGDVFVFPIGLVHYQKNVGPGNAVAIAALSSQNPGVVIIAGTVFGSVPEMDDDVLVKSFQLDTGVVAYLKSKF